ncbi:MAG: S-adenosylmethionine:tRNA ribosyltransferase-isomerase [Acidimicrobiales bacterium]
MSVLAHSDERFSFELPPSLEASEPPEARGLARDAVRMLVTHRSSGALMSSTFAALPELLVPGDLVVINTSGTIPAALDAVAEDGTPLVVHLSTELHDTTWVVELRRPVGRSTQRWSGPVPTGQLQLRGGASMHLDGPYVEGGRLWVASLSLGAPTLQWLETHGRPIHYDYVHRTWPIEMYQNVYATEPGSAEMPSAGRPFTTEMITRLVAKGVDVAPLTLHTGVASLEDGELPYPERAKVPLFTADRVNATRKSGHRVIAVGTTVVRALESCAGTDATAHAFDGWADLVISTQRPVRLVDGLVTGWHEPVSSHLMMLEAMIGRELLEDSYRAALVQGYRWHEFGDVHLIVP